MKKVNFLKGLGAKLALAVVAFGAVLTSCTKEDFNINYKANNAQIYFNPTVIDAATNTVVYGATLAGAEAIVGNPNIAAGEVTITATINNVSGSAIVTYGAVPAGSVVTYSPVILLSSEFELINTTETAVSTKEVFGEGEEGHSHDGKIFNTNASDYFQPFTTTFSFGPEKVTDVTVNTLVTSVELNKFIETLKETTVSSNEVTVEDKASAWSLYTVKAIVTTAKFDADIVSKATGAKVGTVSYLNPLYKVEAEKYEIAHPSHAGHYEAGHGHGDSTNAGGGIVWGE